MSGSTPYTFIACARTTVLFPLLVPVCNDILCSDDDDDDDDDDGDGDGDDNDNNLQKDY
jgi:hypothetical protein